MKTLESRTILCGLTPLLTFNASLAFGHFLLPLEVCGTVHFRRGAGVAEVVTRWWCVGMQALVLPRLGRSFCSRASTPASHTRTSNTELQTAKMFLHIARSLLKLAWKWIKRGVVIPLNNQMRKKGWQRGIYFHRAPQHSPPDRATFSTDPCRCDSLYPRGVVEAPREGAEQV
ncbi:hypothetical protein EDB89DRAFT_1904951 [Lactarius sanguifluus]|nr:hypothetical protein EDB89DRAFT_1904951 [Lactarius sanguifluus]